MPLSAWVADTRECVAMLLRPGTAPPSDVTDHQAVLASAFRQLPLPLWPKLLVRIGRRGLKATPCSIISDSCSRAGGGCAG